MAELGSALEGAPPDAEVPLGHETMATIDGSDAAYADSCRAGSARWERTRLLADSTGLRRAAALRVSVAREQLPGEATIAVTAAYAEAGFEPPFPRGQPGRSPRGRTAFPRLALSRELEHGAQVSEPPTPHGSRRERAFLDDHVLQWVPHHCERLLALAEAPTIGDARD